jgi:adenosylcobinamide-GDP ribazoletransferase
MEHFRNFIAALRFLTIIPLPGSVGTEPEDLQGALPYFGLVGIVLGIFSGLIAWGLWSIFPPMVAAVLLVIVLLSYSGAMHLDGLADSADGFFSARKREQILEIMRDSRIGVMGVIALV